MSEWRPIKTALKDGRPLLVWGGDMMAVAFWCGCRRTWLLPEEPGYKANAESPITWTGVTHWMPLPNPPEDTEE